MSLKDKKVMMKKLILSIAIITLSGTAMAQHWVKNHAQCETEYQSQNCAFTGQAACGYTSNTLYCAYSTDVNNAIPSASSSVNSTIRNSSLGGGYVLDCLASATTCLPWECQADSSCISQQRATTCLADSNNFTCGSCYANYYDCNTTNPTCEVHTGDSGPYPHTAYSGGCASTGSSGVGNVQCSSYWLACDGSLTDTDGCEIPGGQDYNLNTKYKTTCGTSTNGQLECQSANLDCTGGGVGGGDQTAFNIGSTGTDGCEVTKNATPFLENGFQATDHLVYGTVCGQSNAVCEVNHCVSPGESMTIDGCHSPAGSSCTLPGGMPGAWQFDSQTSCTCVEADPEYFETGGFENTRANRYYTSNPLLWGEQLGDGELIEIISTYTDGGGFRVLNNGSIEVSDDNGTTWVPLADAAGDNLGDHTATENLQMSNFWVSNDGDDEGLYVDADGKIGVGTNTPTAALELPAGTVDTAPLKLGIGGTLLTAAENGAMEFDDANLYFTIAGTRHILATQDYVNTQISSISTDRIVADDSSVIVVDTGASGIITFSTDGSEQMRIDPLGNIGIGMTNPNEKLHISGGIVIADHESATPVAGTIEWNTTDSQFKGYNGTDWVALDTQGQSPAGVAGNIQFTDGTDFTADTQLVWDDTNNRLGVGTDTPTEALDVNGAVRVGTTTAANEGAIRYDTGAFEGYDGSQWVALDSQADGKWEDATVAGDIHYSAGKVGVGTTDPQTELDVQGMIRTHDVTDKGTCQSASDVGKIAYETVEDPVGSGNYIGTWYGCKQIAGPIGSISAIDYIWVQLEIFGR